MWDFPGPGIEPMAPALTGRFLATGSPVKPLNSLLFNSLPTYQIEFEYPYFWLNLLIHLLKYQCFPCPSSFQQLSPLLWQRAWVGRALGLRCIHTDAQLLISVPRTLLLVRFPLAKLQSWNLFIRKIMLGLEKGKRTRVRKKDSFFFLLDKSISHCHTQSKIFLDGFGLNTL